jgi:hypothetical protein
MRKMGSLMRKMVARLHTPPGINWQPLADEGRDLYPHHLCDLSIGLRQVQSNGSVVGGGASLDETKDRFISPEPLPDAYVQELLTILIEECNEVGIRASKMKRFGVNEVQPGQSYSNKRRLGLELGDLYCMVQILQEDHNCIDRDDILEGMDAKRVKLQKFLQSEEPPAQRPPMRSG